jgi:hypothetical protein
MKKKIEANIPANFNSMKEELERGSYDEFVRHVIEGRTGKSSYISVTIFQPPNNSSTEPYYLDIAKFDVKKKRIKESEIVRYIAIDAQSVNEIIYPKDPVEDS